MSKHHSQKQFRFPKAGLSFLGDKTTMVHDSLASAIYLLVVCSERDQEQKSQKAEELVSKTPVYILMSNLSLFFWQWYRTQLPATDLADSGVKYQQKKSGHLGNTSPSFKAKCFQPVGHCPSVSHKINLMGSRQH